jgi:plasmid stabilization system protein ParE
MNLKISELAVQELKDAILYYELQQKGLGTRFKKEVRESINRIRKNPITWPQERNEVRKYLLHNFPYKILYSIQDHVVIILAIAHQHRKPG